MKEVISILPIIIVGLLSACDWQFQEPVNMPAGCQDISKGNNFCSFSCDGCEDLQISDQMLTMKLGESTPIGSICTCTYVFPSSPKFQLSFSRARYSLVLPSNMNFNIYFSKNSNQKQCPNENCLAAFPTKESMPSPNYKIYVSKLETPDFYERIIIELKNNCPIGDCDHGAILSIKDLFIHSNDTENNLRFWF